MPNFTMASGTTAIEIIIADNKLFQHWYFPLFHHHHILQSADKTRETQYRDRRPVCCKKWLHQQQYRTGIIS